MSSESKPNKPMPSVAEINAYLEQSAARTRMRLPLAKGAAAVVPPMAGTPPPAAPLPRPSASRALPLQGAPKPAPLAAAQRGAAPETGEWRPFGSDDER